MSATVQEIQDAIIAKLTAALPELTVEAFPDNPGEYELLHPLGAALVQYDGSSYSDNKVSNGAVVQVRTLRFTVVYLVRSLRDSSGCFALMERGAAALSGLCIPGALTAGVLTSDGFLAEADGVWTYVQAVELTTRCAVANHT